MPSKNTVKITSGKETVPGTPVFTTAALPIRDIGGLDRTIENKDDPVIVGAGMDSGQFVVSADVKGPIPISPRACAGYGHILKGIFGTEAAPVEILGIVRIRYTGSSASNKITADNGAKTINSKIGALGAEANDNAFGSSGTITLTNVATDTLAELVSVIDAYTDYEAKLVTGSGASTILSVVAGIWQGKGKWIYLVLTGSGSGAYVHRFTPDLTAGNERPNFSIQKDGFQDNFKYAGCAYNAHSLSAALKGVVEGDVDILGMTEQNGQSASGLSLNDSKAFIFGGGLTTISGVDYNFARKVGAKFSVNGRDDGYGQNSIDRAYHAKGKFVTEGDMTLRLDSASITERPKVEAGTTSPISLLFFAAEAKKIGTSSVAELMIIEIPFAELSDFKFESGDIMDCSLKWKAFNPGGTIYDSPVVVTLITTDSAVY